MARIGSNSTAAWYATMRGIFPTSMRRRTKSSKKNHSLPRYKNEYGENLPNGKEQRAIKALLLRDRRAALQFFRADHGDRQSRFRVLADTAQARVNAIMHMGDVYRSGWITPENFLAIVRDIVKE
jgi:hypothetical protein